MKKTIVFSALAVLVSFVPVYAQSPLADAARREAARRAALKSEPTTYTGEDLAKLPPRARPVPPPKPVTDETEVKTIGTVPAPAGAAADAAAAAPEAAGAPKDEKYWRERIGAVRTSLSRAEMFAEALQTRINSLSTDFVNRDDPAQRQQIAEQRQKALDELSRLQTEMADLKKQIADIEDEARRLGVPPGWLR